MATRQNKAENKTTVPYVDLQAQYRSIRSEVLKALEEVCESARVVQGPKTSKFEEEFAAYYGVNYCVSLNSGTSALHLALRCLDIGPGDEVITVAMKLIATVITSSPGPISRQRNARWSALVPLFKLTQ